MVLIALKCEKVLRLPLRSYHLYNRLSQFRFDNNMNGKIVKYCAQVIAQCFTQQPGINFFETYAPVARIKLVHLLLALAAMLDWEIYAIDTDSAFLNSGLPVGEDIYLCQSPGHVIEGKEDCVWFLIKALYGLKQAGHLWYKKLKEILIKMGLPVCKADPCVFICCHSLAISFISSQVDNLALCCRSKAEVSLPKSQFKEHLTIKDLEIKSILGIEVIWDHPNCTISLSHCWYINEIVTQYNQTNSRLVHSLMEIVML